MLTLTLPNVVIRVLSTLQGSGFQAYIVGGAVRDLLQNKKVYDWDFTTNAVPDQIMRLFKESFYDNEFGTVRVAGKHLAIQFRLPASKWDDMLFDITTYRTESGYSDRRRPDKVNWGEDIHEDLSRRDFTINAMALKASSKDRLEMAQKASQTQDKVELKLEIIDPFGGRVGIAKKMIKTVGNPDMRFNEDALRMMRAIRIGAQLAFTIEEQTLESIRKNAALIRHISWERIRDEFLKLMGSEYPADGILLMHSSGLLEYIIPELLEMRGIPQAGHHVYDVWTHSIESLRHCPSTDPLVRLSTLLHDVGKPRAFRKKDGKITFYNHEVIGANIASEIADRLRFSKKDREKLYTLVRWHMFVYDPKMTDASIRRFIRRVGVDNINDMILMRIGDRIGGGSKATSWRLRELQERIGQQLYEPMSIRDLKVNGNDVMKVLGIKPGPKVGEILNRLFEEIMEEPKNNEREYLLKRIKELD